MKRLWAFFLLLPLVILLSGCGGRQVVTDQGPLVPVVHKYAKRAYNKPYQIKGIWYHPQPYYNYDQVGIASYYGGTDVFHGRRTSNGEIFDMNKISAAHKTIPIPSVVRVTNLRNGRSLKVRINDRGPFIKGRIIDVSRKVAQLLGFYRAGTTKVRVQVLMPETLDLVRGYKPTLYHPEKKDRLPGHPRLQPTLFKPSPSRKGPVSCSSVGLQRRVFPPHKPRFRF